MTKIFLTTEIEEGQTAGSKARQDVLKILDAEGYRQLYLPLKLSLRNIFGFWKKLSRMARGKTAVVIEYPCWQKKRMFFVSLCCRLQGIKLYGVIHDIGALRFQMSEKRDMTILKLFDGLVSHNYSMTAWLRKKGYKKKIVDLELFDYLVDHHAKTFYAPELSIPLRIFYAGNLAPNKAAFIYDPKMSQLENVRLLVHGPSFDKEAVSGPALEYRGVFDPGVPELEGDFHFGLIWEGESVDTCSGHLGEYTRFNNPHKLSLYISLGLPVVVWKEAAVARFVTSHQIGTTIGSLSELAELHKRLDADRYQTYVKNIRALSEQVREGHFLTTALKKMMGA